MKLIPRQLYLTRLRDYVGTPDIKIITGIRRCGKSELLKAFLAELRKSEPQSNIIFIDLQDLASEPLKEYHALHAFVKAHYQSGKNNYLCIDEVQLCPNFELALNSLHSSGLFDIYVTGSNAFLLSSDLATLFTGRCVELTVYPFSFREYCTYFDCFSTYATAFESYVLQGGLPGSYLYPSNFHKTGYIRDVFSTIMHRDLLTKYGIKDPALLSVLAEFLLDNIGNLTSTNKIATTLTSAHTSTNHTTIGKYLQYLEQAFLFYKVQRYDLKGKKYLTASHKYYAVDTGIRYAVLGTRNMDYDRAYENIVALELLRRSYAVYVGKLYAKEIDFVAQRGSERYYIQVSDDISSENTLSREIEPLLSIKEAYPKLLLARTGHPTYTREGVIICDLASFLLAQSITQAMQIEPTWPFAAK